MGVDLLVARMTEDAQTRIAALRAAADAEIATLDQHRAQAASMDQSRMLDARHTAREAAFAVERAHARRRAAVRVLTAQHAFVERVFARAQALAVHADACTLELLPRDVEAALGHLGGQAATLRSGPALAAALRRCVVGRGDIQVTTDDTMAPGFVAATRDGTCTIDCTLPARLAALRPRLQAELLARVTP